MMSLDVVQIISSDHPEFSAGDVAVCVPYAGIWYKSPRFAVGVEKARVYGYQPFNRERHRSIDATRQLLAKLEDGTVLKPTGTNVIIRSPRRSDTIGGLYVPDSSKAPVNYGVIEAVGKGRVNECGKFLTPQFKPGDKVLAFDQSAAFSYQDGDDVITIVDAEAIHAIEGETAN